MAEMYGSPHVTIAAEPAFTIPIMAIWQGLGYNMVIFLAGLQGIPEQLYEAATVDGADAWARFRHITLPLLSPTTFFVIVMSVINSFQIFTVSLVMTNGGPAGSTETIVLYLYRAGFEYFRMGDASAIAWVLSAMIFLFTFIQTRLQKRWVYYE